MDKNKLKIRTFTGKLEEWLDWKERFQAILEDDSNELLDTLTEEKPDSNPQQSKKLEKWIKNNRKIYYKLVLYTEGPAAGLVRQFRSTANGQEAWRCLISKYEHKGKAGKVALQDAMSKCFMKENEDPDNFLARLEDIRERLRILGDEIKEDTMQAMLIAKLPKKNYAVLIAVLEADEKLTYEETKERIRTYWKRHIQQHEDSSTTDEESKAFMSKYKQRKSSWEPRMHKSASEIKCHGCGQLGHIKPDCPNKNANSSNSKWGPNTDRRGDSNDRSWRPPIYNRGPFTGTCNLCGMKGHRASNCIAAKNALKEHKANIASTAADKKDPFALLAGEGFAVSDKYSWVVDSGCTAHMVSNREILSDLHAGKGHVIVAGGRKLESIGQGNIRGVIMTQDGRAIHVIFENVLLVPELAINLLSVQRIIAKGGKVVFNEPNAYIEMKGSRIPLRAAANLYELDFCSTGTTSEITEQAYATIVGDLWHGRLGHRNLESIKQLSKLDVGVPVIKEISACDICQLGKHTRASFGKRNSTIGRATKPLELVHVDLIGPIEVTSLGGARYAIVFTDDYSKWRTIYFLRDKSEGIIKLRAYLNDMSGLLKGAKVVRVHSDGGGEFMNEEFKDYCKRNGILQTTSSPHTPEQNGVAERTNRIVIEMARCLRIGSGLGKEMWATACDTSVYLLNRLPSDVINGETPYQRLFGKPASMKHLRIYGCEAYVHVNDTQRKKFDDKAWKGILVGYDPHNNTCYRIYDPVRKRFYMSTHVTFNEQVFPARKDQPKQGIAIDPEPAIVSSSESGSEHNKESMTKDASAIDQREATNSVGDSTSSKTFHWTTPWCHDPNCNNRGIHFAHLGIHYAYAVANDIFEDPRSYKEAMRSAESEHWRKATIEEYESLMQNGTWSLVHKPPGVNIIGTKWVFKAKRGENGQIVRFKARLVAQGFTQEYGRDYLNTFSPVVRFSSIRIIFVLAAEEDWELCCMDVKTAFLNANIKEEIYIRQPEGFEQRGLNGEELVCRLHRSIYGLKQASRNWNETIDEWLVIDYGMERSLADSCVYIKDSNGEKLIVTLWVDDLIIAGSSKRFIEDFKTAISARFCMNDLGDLKGILGMEIVRDRAKRTIKISQSAYLNQILQRFGMSNCKPVGTPMEGTLCRLSKEEGAGGKPNKEYMSIVGSLLYASMVSRPDITYAVQVLGRHLQASGPEHMIAAKRILRYLQGTKDMGLIYEGKSDSKGGVLIGFSDSDWGGDIDTRRSTTGYLFTFDGNAITWGSRLQPTVALSSAESEYMAMSSAVQEAIHLRQLLKDLGFEQRESTVIFEDNQGCIALSGNPVFHKRTKHIDIRFHFIRERVASGEVEIQYISTEHQLADVLTKTLPKARTIKLTKLIMGDRDT